MLARQTKASTSSQKDSADLGDGYTLMKLLQCQEHIWTIACSMNTYLVFFGA